VKTIRPLVTISFLILVGVFLYMKLTETEPIVPADVADWSIPSEVQIGGGTSQPSGNGDFNVAIESSSNESSSAPAYNASQFGEAPPAYNETAPAYSPDEVPEAPAWDTTVEEQSTAQAESSPQPTTETDEETPEPPAGLAANLPPLPSMQGSRTAMDSEKETAQQAEQESSLDTHDRKRMNDSLTGAGSRYQNIGQFEGHTSGEQTTAEHSLPFDSSTPDSREGSSEVTPTASSPSQASLFSATRLAVQAALDRGELSQALLLLSDWYGDPSLSEEEVAEVENLLSQLAGSVIYSTEHRLEPPYMVQTGEQLEDIAEKYEVPWQLLAKINGLDRADQLQPGQKLKVVRGPFSAKIDLRNERMVLMLDRRYAGQFDLNVDTATSIEEGYWSVNQKLLTPGNTNSFSGASPDSAKNRSILLTNTSGATNQVTILRGPDSSTPATNGEEERIIELQSNDVEDVFDILSLGSQVIIRR